MPLDLAPARRLPPQRTEDVLLHADRYARAAAALALWSEGAKRCVEYFEGKQWQAEDIKKLAAEKRPALTLNKIKPLIKLVMGYFINNRTEIKYLPGHDGTGTAATAAALSHIAKQISEISQLPFVDVEVALDGFLAGRGFWDFRLDFEENDFGDGKWGAADPFATYLDPDLDQYDINAGNFVMTSRFVSTDEVEYYYGRDIAGMVAPLIDGKTYSQVPGMLYDGHEEITPWRRIGGDEDKSLLWASYGSQFYDWVDRARKTIRLLDIQHYVRVMRWMFVDLDTGDRSPVPDHWDRARVDKALAWAQMQGYQMTVRRQMDRRLRWTHMIGDVIAYDDWAPYRTFTIIGFFPYFRRGKTKGLVEDLLDPQDEINKRRSARLNIIGRSSAGGWMYAEGSLDPMQEANLERFGSTPGFKLKWKVKPELGAAGKPEQIQPAVAPIAMSQLEHEAEEDIKEIAGINDSALGQVDTVQSGRALEAKQRQSIVGIEPDLSNYSRSKELCGRKQLEVIQDFYTEQRVIRTVGQGSNPIQMMINQRTADGIINNVTVGKYAIAVDETPLSKTFLDAQFEEVMRMKELGMPIPDDFIIDASSIARKDELKLGLQAARQMMAAAGVVPPDMGGAGPGPGGSRVGPDGGSMPNEAPAGPPPAALPAPA